MSDTITLTSAQLYEQVWSVPMSRLAGRYGISDVALAKHCKKHDIPRPPRGHWAKLAFDKPSPKAPLPVCAEERLAVITLVVDRPPRADRDTQPKEKKPDEPVFDQDILDLLQRAEALPMIQASVDCAILTRWSRSRDLGSWNRILHRPTRMAYCSMART
jgi:hypothetical protein